MARTFVVACAAALPLLLGAPAWSHSDHPAAEPADTPPPVPAASHPATQPSEDGPKLAPLVTRLIDDPLTDAGERRRLLIFHGQFDRVPGEGLTLDEQAMLAWLRYDLGHPALSDPQAPVLLRAQAALARGEPEAAEAMLREQTSARAAVLRAEALTQTGRTPEAVALLQPWRAQLKTQPGDDAAELTAAAEGLVRLAELEGRPAQDYKTAMGMLGRARTELDRLYWPAFLAEARLLADKDNAPEAAATLSEALTLNPACGDAWYLLGRLHLTNFGFTEAQQCITRLRKINPQHPLADLLEAHLYLMQKDPGGARKIIEPTLAKFPGHREMIALLAATEALAYDQAATQQALDHLDGLSPGSPLGPLLAGRYLSMARQYPEAEAMLRQAIARSPQAPTARVELGLLLMQAGKEEAARTELVAATRLDPFHKRAANQLALVEELLSYEKIETEHFVIRYRAGIDEALARDMPAELEDIYRNITSVFEHRPANKTLIQIMPDEQRFAVRITGMPWIWTIGACTGDVIAITPPRQGAGQRGPYDWARVIRHEFVHTVTLDQTANRIPHWFTEACAVSQEPGGRDFNTAQLLASALQAGKLFDLEAINWAFIRPRTPAERPLAYAQAHWMLEYITATWGHSAIVKMLRLFREGRDGVGVVEAVTEQSSEAFLTGFKAWATRQVEQWGLQPQGGDEKVAAVLKAGVAATDEELTAALQAFPNHADLLRLRAERLLAGGGGDAVWQAVNRYALARPVDPWPHRVLAALAMKAGDGEAAVPHLMSLDTQEQMSGAWARQLALIHQEAARFEEASVYARRAIDREPYNATYRETAAAIDLQRGDAQAALHQVKAAAILEPQRSSHQVRLAALYQRMNQPEAAVAAARKARELDPQAPVEAFLPK